MSCTARMKVGNVVLEVQADDPKALIRRMGAYAELFQDEKCGACGSAAIIPQYRRTGNNAEFEYFNLRCLNHKCGAQLDYGQKKDGKTLWVKREKGTNGWYIFQRSDGEQRHPDDQGQSFPADGGGDIPF